MRRSTHFACCAVAGALGASAVCAQEATETGSPKPPAVVRQSSSEMLASARAAASRGDHAEAVKLFDAILRSEPKNENALRGKASIHINDNEWSKAIPALEKIVAIRPKDRTATLNLAGAYLKLDPPNAMRAAKLVMDYLGTASGAPDETMANALGTALSKADEQARKAFFYPKCLEFYRRYDQKLEAQRRDGKKRWGAEWLAGGLADEKWNLLKTRTVAVDVAHRNWSEASVETRKSKEALAHLQLSFELVPQERMRRARQRVTTAERAETQAVRRLSAAKTELARTEAPPMLDSVSVTKME